MSQDLESPVTSTNPENQKPKPPTSPRKLASCHTNGSKSHGPKTQEGLEKCSTAPSQRTTHGLLAKTIVIHGESEPRFLALVDTYITTHRPSTEPELDAIYRMAIATWRQRRVVSFQTIDFNREIARQDPADTEAPAPFRATLAFRSLCEDQAHSQALAHRYETTYERQYNRALRDLALLKALHKHTLRNSIEGLTTANNQHIGTNWEEEKVTE